MQRLEGPSSDQADRPARYPAAARCRSKLVAKRGPLVLLVDPVQRRPAEHQSQIVTVDDGEVDLLTSHSALLLLPETLARLVGADRLSVGVR